MKFTKNVLLKHQVEKKDIKFPRDVNGHVDLNDGVYDDERRNTLHVK